MRLAGLVAAAVVLVLIVSGAVGVLAASGDLPWQSRVAEVARDDGATPAASPTITPFVPAAVKATFAKAFPNLPKLPRPTNMLQVPESNRMLLTEQDGLIVSFDRDANASQTATVLDWRDKTSRDGNEEGLLGFAFDPGFARNGFVYLYYSASGGARRTVISRLHASGAGSALRIDPASELVILTVPQPFSNHNGGQIAFGPDGMLYAGIGDGGSEGDPNGNGQDLTKNLLATIIRIDVRNAGPTQPYAIPADNPFANAPNGARPETWAYGLRNPWRFSFDDATGTLWVGDVGQDVYEEIDIVTKGENYGWNIMEASHCYKPKSGCNQSGLVLPVAEYSHDGGACSVTGGFVYHGSAVPGLRGYYVFGDYCSGKISALPAAEARNGANLAPILLMDANFQIPSFAVDSDGELYALGFDGQIWKMAPG